MSLRLRALATAIAAGAACTHGGEPTRTVQGGLGGDVARVGNYLIAPELVARVADSKSESPRAALDALVADSLAAQAAVLDGLDRRADVSWRLLTASARAGSQHFMAEARALGSPTDDELATLAVVHAVVLRSPSLPEERGLAVASAIHDAVSGARSVEDFEARAKSVPHTGVQVVVESLPQFGADGRHPGGGSPFDAAFVAAAFSLRSFGEMTPLFDTPFGWHTVFLSARTPADAVSLAARRADLAGAVLEMRARARAAVVLRQRKERSPVQIDPLAETLSAQAVNRSL